MEVSHSLLDLVGDTPLVRLDRVGRDLACHLLAKLEFLNPGGSVKDRPALAMIEAAERAGLLGAGGTIVEPTSGNTGVGLAIVAARKGYHCVFVMPDKIAAEKIDLLRAYGAEVVVCPTTVAPEHPDSYYSVSDRLARRDPRCLQAQPVRESRQSPGPRNFDGPRDLAPDGRAGLALRGRYRHRRDDHRRGPLPEVPEPGRPDRGRRSRGVGLLRRKWPALSRRRHRRGLLARHLRPVGRRHRRHGERPRLVSHRSPRDPRGGHPGGRVDGDRRVGRPPGGTALGPDDVVVVLIPDSGRGYLSKLYNDGWMADFGFLRSGGQSVGEVIANKGGELPPLIHVHPDDSVRDVIAILREFGVSQVPVLKVEPPVVAAEVLGSVHDRDLLEAAFQDHELLDPPGERGHRPAASHHRGGRTGGDGRDPHGEVRRRPRLRRRTPRRHPDPVGRPRRARRALRHVTRAAGTTTMDTSSPRHGFETRAIHAGQDPDPVTGSVVPAVHLATTYRQRAVGAEQSYEYARSGNPDPVLARRADGLA